MDELKIKLSTKLMRGMVAKIVSKIIFNKTGIRVKIELNEIGIEIIGDDIRFHINADGSVNNKYLLKINRLVEEEELV